LQGHPRILDVLELEPVETNLFRSRLVIDEPYRLYGGQVAAQALCAAGRTAPGGRLPHSLHGYFLRSGNPRRPTVFEVYRDRDGRSFSARRVVAIQDGDVIFSMSASFAAPQPGSDHHFVLPEIPPPDALLPLALRRYPSFELRTADFNGRVPASFWIRCVDTLPDDPLTHAAVLAYISDMSSGLIALEGEQRHTSASLDHAVWFHRPARMDDWTWLELTPHTAASGRGLYTGGVHGSDKVRVATIAQEALFRPER
jgi:acyl-CoA thioesterase-2